MTTMKKFGRAALVAVLAFSLTLPTPALAWAASGSGLAAAQVAPADVQALDASADVWDGSVDTSWYDATKTEFTLTKPAQLAGLAALVNGWDDASNPAHANPSFRGVTIKLGNDIWLNATAASGLDRTGTQRSWTPIADLELTDTTESVDGGTMPKYYDTKCFDGTLDGQGHVIKNLYVYNDVEGTYGGVQAFIANAGGHATIQNLGIDGGYVYGRVAAGLVAISHVVPETDGTDPNVAVVDGEKTFSFPHIIGCFNSANVRGNGSTTRGLAGIFAGEEQYRPYNGEGNGGKEQEENYHGGAYIANCYNLGDITQVSTSSNSAGGIAGTGCVQMYGCYNFGTVESDSRYAASLAGVLVGSSVNVGQNHASGFAGCSAVADSYAVEGSIWKDDQGNTKLFNLIDATHGKGQTGKWNPAVTGEADTYGYSASVAFKASSWFAGADSWKALSQSFVTGTGHPVLYWQSGGEQWDINALDADGYKRYWINEIDQQQYTGSPLKPAVTMQYEVEASDGSWDTIDLHQGSDFTVSYSDNVEIGENAKATVKGIGRFYNGRSVTFKIVGGSLSDTTIEPIGAQWWYGRDTVNPDVVVKAPNGDTLTEDTDYTLTITGVPSSASEFSSGKATATAKVAPMADSTAFTGEKSIDFTVLQASETLSGEGTQSNPWKLATKGDLQFLAHQTSTQAGSETYGAADKHFQLTDDIDATAHCDAGDDDYLTDRPVDPLFSYYAFGENDTRYGGFGGTISGAYTDSDGSTANHTITIGQTQKALQIDDFERLTALFVYTRYGASPTFENLTIAGSSYAPDGAAAGLLIMAQPGTITVKDCVNKARVQGDQSFMGAAAGFIVETSQSQTTELVMENCVNEGEIVSATKAAGFVANLGGAKMTFTSCANKGAVTAGSGGGAGGFVAYLNGTDSADAAYGNAIFNGCANTGAVTVKSSGDAGGIVAWNQDKVKGISFNRCSNTGTVTYRGPGNAGAGIMGRAYSPAKFTNCYNNALIQNNGADIEPAGILGYAAAAEKSGEHYAQYRNADTSMNAQGEPYSFLMENVYSAGGFGDRAKEAGGLVGNLWLHQRLQLVNAYYESGDGAASKAVSYDFGEEWPGAVDPPETDGDAVQMDTEAMKEATFASMLGTSFSAAAADEAGEVENGGFPVLLPLSKNAEIKDLSDGGKFGSSSPKELTYRGAGIELTGLVVQDKDENVLKEGRDYVVFYSADGTQGTAIVRGIGSYTGTLEYTYNINPCDLSQCRISAVKGMNYANVIGTGASQDVTLTNPAGKPMTAGVDYEILYANNTAPGTAYLMAHAKGPYYTGTIMRPFTIAKGDLSQVQVRGLQSHYPATNTSGGLYIYERLTAANGQDLQRTDYYSADKSGKHDYVRVFYSYDEATGKYDLPVYTNNDQSQGWATHVTKAGRYMVELRADGYDTVRRDNWTNGYWYGKTSATFTYGNRIESDDDVLVTGVEADYGQRIDSSGNAVDIASDIVPRLVNKGTGYSLTEGEDYGLAFKYLDASGKWVDKGAVDYVGEYKLEIEGKGSWFGTREVLFSVVSMYDYIGDKTEVAGIQPSYYYTGSAIKPVPTSVKQEAGNLVETLAAGVDYELGYVDADGKTVTEPTEPGTYYAVVSGLGDYKGAKRVMFKIEKPIMKVYVRTGTGAATLKKQYTSEQFTALKSLTAATNPVSALYCDTSGSNWSVASTNNYVTVADLLADAGVSWRSGVSMTYAGGSFNGRTYTYDQVNSLMFYPNTSATAIETWMGRKAPFVLSISDQSLKIGSQYTSTAAEAESFNLQNLDQANMPRAIMGVSQADYVNASKAASSMMGSRLVKNVDSITVTLPKAANTVKASAKGATQSTTFGAAKAIPASSLFNVSGAVGSVSYSRASGDARIGVASNGTVTVPASLPAGSYPVAVKVTAAGNASYAAGSATASFTVQVGKAANTLSVSAKSPTVKQKKLKKKAQKVAASKVFSVSGAQGAVTYAKVKKGSNAKISVSKAGKVTVPKGMKKGAYTVKVKVIAAGDANHEAATKTVTVKVKVK